MSTSEAFLAVVGLAFLLWAFRKLAGSAHRHRRTRTGETSDTGIELGYVVGRSHAHRDTDDVGRSDGDGGGDSGGDGGGDGGGD